jgi:Protein of unknown function (DUF664)
MSDQAPAPPAGDETSTLVGSLERQRRILAWKCSGLDAEGLRATLAPSTITLGSLLKHLANVEDDYFTMRLAGRDAPPPWDAVDWEADPLWDWRTAADDSPQELMALWETSVARSRATVDEALATGRGLDQPAKCTPFEGVPPPSLRRILIDMIEEYSRHAGHADLIRESIDGLVGENPPR